MSATVTITISHDGMCSVRFDPPPKKGGHEFRQEAAALCLHLLHHVYGNPAEIKKKPGEERRADPRRNQPRNQRRTKHE